MITNAKPIIDVCCGSKMFWFDKNHPETLFMDNRELEDILCDGRKLIVKPDVIGDFRNIPYPDKSFKLAVFDPPHLVKLGENSWMAKKYGILSINWKNDIKQGFDECMRVLEPFGILIFKWNEQQIKLKDVLKIIKHKPLFGDRRSKTIWMVFMKEG
jgi:23S rRNA G2069 N7-methylase RlmK/C1962 C5-methylase RlmI